MYILKNNHKVEVRILPYGGIVAALLVPDRDGRVSDVVLGFDHPSEYRKRHPFFGALIGRFANRIGRARFTLHSVDYRLAANNGANSLHGGSRGFDKQDWTLLDQSPSSLSLQYVSADGEEGYPGTLTASVRYSLTGENEFVIDYAAEVAGAATPVNLTNHSYFNLSGVSGSDVLDHQVEIYSDRFTPIDATLIPTGELRRVEGTPFDFRKSHTIGERIEEYDEQLRFGKGYDHNYVLGDAGQMRLAARVHHPPSGRVMEVLTDQPAVQFYSGNNLDGALMGKGGTAYQRRAGFSLETQHYPDSPNQPHFPSTILKPGEIFRSQTIYRFSVR